LVGSITSYRYKIFSTINNKTRNGILQLSRKYENAPDTARTGDMHLNKNWIKTLEAFLTGNSGIWHLMKLQQGFH